MLKCTVSSSATEIVYCFLVHSEEVLPETYETLQTASFSIDCHRLGSLRSMWIQVDAP